MLYVGLGDGGSERDPHGYGQNLQTLLGKILRIDPNGNAASVPPDNPFVGRTGVRSEIWMYGLRNPWRFTWDRATGEMWIGDVGQNKYEEVDVARAGERGTNWGWSLREGFHAFKGARPPGARDPLFETDHADGNCAIVGGYVYRGRAIPALQGMYVFGDNCKSNIYATTEARPQPQDLGLKIASLTTFGEDANGELYAASRDGSVYRLTPG
jgi:glucose/arabinose dehydrogenase